MILDGKLTAATVRKQVAENVKRLNDTVTAALIMVGDNQASQVYVRNKQKACDEVGINVESYLLEENTSQKELFNSLIPAFNVKLRLINKDDIIIILKYAFISSLLKANLNFLIRIKKNTLR